jgi:UDP-N-acetyl-D-mannosaminuronate dehydrogenase
VGLPTALGFAELGWEVIGAAADASKVAMIRSGPEAVRSADFEYVDMGRSPLEPDVVRSTRFESVGTGEKLRVEQPVTTGESVS